MGDVIRKHTGEITGIVATVPQADIDRERRIVEAGNAKREAYEKEQAAREAKARKALPTPRERKAAAIAGLRRYATKAKREGDTAIAARLTRHADDAAAAVEECDRIESDIARGASDPLGDAVAAAAKELRKVLPRCFPSEGDAVTFSKLLPLVEARTAANVARANNERLRRKLAKTEANYWRAICAGARLALNTLDDDAAIRRLVEAAML